MGKEYSGSEVKAGEASIVLYGPPRSKKSRTAATAPGKKFWIDFDKGAWAMAGDLLTTEDTVFEPDDWPDTLSRMTKLVDQFARAPHGGPYPYDNIVIDSGTEGYHTVMSNVLQLPRGWGGKKRGPPPLDPRDAKAVVEAEQASGDETVMIVDDKGVFRRAVAELRDYGLAHERWLVFLRECRKFPANLILICHQGVEKDEDSGAVIRGGVMLPGQLMEKVPLLFDYYFHMEEYKGDFWLATKHKGHWPAGYRKGPFEDREPADLTAILRKAGLVK